MNSGETISRAYAVDQVRNMATQFAELYFTFSAVLRQHFGEETALEIVQKVLFQRAAERSEDMVRRAEQEGVARTPENIIAMTDVPFLGWDSSLGRETCPYGAAWNKRIEQAPWFRRFACLYCDVTDTTIAEIFTGDHSHHLHHNVVLGDESCERSYFPSEDVKNGTLTYGKL